MDSSKRDYQTSATECQRGLCEDHGRDCANGVLSAIASAHDKIAPVIDRRRVWVRFVVAAVGAALFAGIAFAQDGVAPPRFVQQNAFSVVGIEASSNRAKEEGPDAIVGKLWQQFTRQNLIDKIPGRTGQSIIAVYTDFSDDGHGEFTLILGAQVRPVPNPVIPDGMVVKTVPAGRYAVFTTPRGPAAKVIPETWKQIVDYFASPAHGQRAFDADYEVYDQGSVDLNNVQVDIYVGLK